MLSYVAIMQDSEFIEVLLLPFHGLYEALQVYCYDCISSSNAFLRTIFIPTQQSVHRFKHQKYCLWILFRVWSTLDDISHACGSLHTSNIQHTSRDSIGRESCSYQNLASGRSLWMCLCSEQWPLIKYSWIKVVMMQCIKDILVLHCSHIAERNLRICREFAEIGLQGVEELLTALYCLLSKWSYMYCIDTKFSGVQKLQKERSCDIDARLLLYALGIQQASTTWHLLHMCKHFGESSQLW